MKKGLIQIYTGNGKGKTTAATGQIIRAIARDFRVMMVYFLKEEGGSGEMDVLKCLGVETLFWGGKYGRAFLKDKPVENKKRVREESGYFLQQIKDKLKKQNYDLVVFDEINVALDHGLVKEEELLSFLKDKPTCLEIILTGRKASQCVLNIADLVTEMREVKHPYNKDIKMRKGIEY
ncbi:cob(I)yrinic acid a,c-diamide adenosyltransferase [Candidatus Aerophobetes bacterium]|nr:cob(I)yrinic acid a,c-diamide adenosyltransferase [Candidatus Aerophobetes bacterium]